MPTKEEQQEIIDLENTTVEEKPEGSDFVLSPVADELPEEPESEAISVDDSLANSFDPFAEPEEDIEQLAEEVETEQYRVHLKEARDLQKASRAFAGQRGAFAKLCHVNAAGQRVFYHTIRDIGRLAEDVTGLEHYIHSLINDNEEWPGGKWLLELCNAKGQIKKSINLHFAEKPKQSKVSNDGLVATSAIKQNADMMDKVLTFAHEKKEDSSLLVELIKNNQKDSTEEMTKMLAFMQAMNPPKQQNTEVLTTLITALSPVVLAMVQSMTKKKEMDPIQMMAALKDMSGASPQGQFTDALGMFSQISEIVQSMQPSSNPIHDILKQVMPHVGGVLENVAGGLREMVQMKREALALQAGGMHGRRQLSAPEAEAMPVSSQSNQAEETVTMHPIMKKIYDAVINKDASFYPELETIIKMNMGDGNSTTESLVDGSITVEAFVEQIANFIPQFNQPEMKAQMIEYMQGFIMHKLEEFEANNYITKCDKCPHEVAFGSEKEYIEDEQGGVCGENECTGQLQPVVTKVPEPPIQEEKVQIDESPSLEGANNNGSEPSAAVEQGAPNS